MSVPTFTLGELLVLPPNENVLQVNLFTGPPLGESGTRTLAQLQPAQFPGYTASGFDVWEDAEVISEKCVRRQSKEIEFRSDDVNNTPPVLGYYVTMFDGTKTILVGLEEFDTPRLFTAKNKNLILKVEVVVYDTTTL